MIGNMDETPIFFECGWKQNGINKDGEKTVLVKTKGQEKQRFNVVLTSLADGTKLPPMVNLKRHILKRNFRKE